MLISRQQFEDEDAIVTFIGPSGAGKSGRSVELAQNWKCDRWEADAMIGQSEELLHELARYEGKDAAEQMGRWMGMPWNSRFPEREKQYLQIERDVMRRIVETAGAHRQLIIDTTGSAIYHPRELAALQRGSLVVYLEADEVLRRELLQKYLRDPKPVCFNGLWSPAKGESHEQTLARCYPILLEIRHRLYSSFADVTVNARDLKKSQGAVIEDLIDEIAEQLPSKPGQ